MLKKIILFLLIASLVTLTYCTNPTEPEWHEGCEIIAGEPHPLTGVQETIKICE